MNGKNAEMRAIFQELSEGNKDAMLLAAQELKAAQEPGESVRKVALTNDQAVPVT